MVECLLSSETLLGVNNQQLADKVLCVARNRSPIFGREIKLSAHDLLKHFRNGVTVKRRKSAQQNVRDDSDRPQINARSISSVGQNFRSDVSKRKFKTNRW